MTRTPVVEAGEARLSVERVPEVSSPGTRVNRTHRHEGRIPVQAGVRLSGVQASAQAPWFAATHGKQSSQACSAVPHVSHVQGQHAAQRSQLAHGG